MAELPVVSNPGLIDCAWLTAALQQAGIDAEVTGFSAENIGTGQVGANVRFRLRGNGDLPNSVVGKFPSLDPASRKTGTDTGNYRREVHFYRYLLPKVNIRTPRVLFADCDEDGDGFVILMEDLAPGRQGDQIKGCGAEMAALALTQLAHLHGPVWGDKTLLDGDLIVDRSRQSKYMQRLYDAFAPGFIQRYRSRLTPGEKQMVTQVGENMIAFTSGYQGEQTLVHVDYRLDNMMFGGPYPLAVVDWQSPGMDCALIDVAYFMGTSLDVDARGATEQTLVKGYLDALSGYGVSLDWETCWHFYRHYAPAGLVVAVIASMMVGETERGNDMFMAMAQRSIRMCRELDAIDALRG